MQNDLLISVVTYNRSEIAIKSLSQLISILPNEIPIIVSDDCTSEEGLKYFLGFSLRMNVYFNKSNLGVDLNNVNRLKDKPVPLSSYVYLTDSDVQYSSKFWEILVSAKKYLESNHNIFAITLFNTQRNGCHNEIGNTYYWNNLALIEKRSFGGISVLIKYEDFVNAMYFYKGGEYDGNEGWDWALCRYAQKKDRRLIATKDSYVEHIGIDGVNSSENGYDVANNFIE